MSASADMFYHDEGRRLSRATSVSNDVRATVSERMAMQMRLPPPAIPESPSEIAKSVGVSQRMPEYWFPDLCEDLIRLRSERLHVVSSFYTRVCEEELFPGLEQGQFRSDMHGAEILASQHGLSPERLRRHARLVRRGRTFSSKKVGRTPSPGR